MDVPSCSELNENEFEVATNPTFPFLQEKIVLSLFFISEVENSNSNVLPPVLKSFSKILKGISISDDYTT